MNRSAVIIACGRSYDHAHMPALWELGDTCVLNYAYLPIVEHHPTLLPAYHCCLDNPMRFCTYWHQCLSVRSIINSQFVGRARVNGFKNYQTIAIRKHGEKTEPNPFLWKDYLLPYKTICAAVQYLVKANYQTIYFYGCDFLVDRENWYAVGPGGVRAEDQEVAAKNYRAKCNSNEEQLTTLRRWHPYAQEMNCEWVSLSPISRMNSFIRHEALEGRGG